MAFFRVNKNLLADPPTLGAMQRSFTSMEEMHPISTGHGGEHPQFKWFRVQGPGIPPEDIEIELEFNLIDPNTVIIRWQPLKH